MVLNKDVVQKTLTFETVRINPAIDPDGGYWLKANLPQPLADRAVFREVAEASLLALDEKDIAFIVDKVLSTVARKVATDGVPRKIGDLIKFAPVVRGKVKGPYGAYDPEACSCVVAISALKGLERTVDTSSVRLVNARGGVKVTLSTVMTVGAESDGTVIRSRAIRAIGTNVQFDAALGDTVTVSWTDGDGEAQSVSITPRTSDDRCLEFDWPAALAEVADGTELTFAFTTRAGVAEADPQVNEVQVRLVSAA